MVYPLLPSVWLISLLAVVAEKHNSANTRGERNLMLVLPVLQGPNISDAKLQYVFTKAPITVVINDSVPVRTTSRPKVSKHWPASFASKAQVFLVEPVVLQTSTPFYNIFSKITRPTPTSTTTQSSGDSTTYQPEKFVSAEVLGTSPESAPSKGYDFNSSVSEATWKTSTDRIPIKLVEPEFDRTTSSPSETYDNVAAGTVQTNTSDTNSSLPDGKTVAQLALDLQASTNRLTNDIKSMLLHLGLLTESTAPQLHGDSNELSAETAAGAGDEGDSTSYLHFKNIPANDDPAIRDDMRNLLDSFGLLPASKNETNIYENTLGRTRRDTVAREATGPFHNRRTSLRRTSIVPNSQFGRSRRNFASSSAEPKSAAIKPSTSFSRRSGPAKAPTRIRAVDSETYVNTVNPPNNKSSNSGGTASAEDLSGSFGGNTSNGDRSSKQTATDQPSTNGFYYWVDWNRFFNVTGNPVVSVQFSSRAGDPKKFIPIDYINKLK